MYVLETTGILTFCWTDWVRIIINQGHSEKHHHDSIKLGQILVVFLPLSLWPSKDQPETNDVGNVEHQFDGKVFADVTNQMADDCYQRSNDLEASPVLQQTYPYQHQCNARHPGRRAHILHHTVTSWHVILWYHITSWIYYIINILHHPSTPYYLWDILPHQYLILHHSITS